MTTHWSGYAALISAQVIRGSAVSIGRWYRRNGTPYKAERYSSSGGHRGRYAVACRASASTRSQSATTCRSSVYGFITDSRR